MKLVSCPRCERHVANDVSSCPFCGTKLGTTSGIARIAMVAAVGLTMSSCLGGDDGGSDYAGPGPMPEDTGVVSNSNGNSDTDAETDAETETETGATTSGGEGESGGQDYAGAAPESRPVKG